MEVWKLFGRITAILRRLTPGYHPERHYMRGPGPACAKRGGGGPAPA